jgi:phosphoadenosine phosphosulfate reductase
VADYRSRHDLVVNPLLAQGYPSVGCWPCTEPAPDDDPRCGRWVGSTKTECGLHR